MSVFEKLPKTVRIVEVGPRDGLQNEPRLVPAAEKIALIEALAEAGHTHIEVTSMVRQDLVPQLADAEEVLSGLRPRPGVTYTVLVPNERGLERALGAGARSIALFTAASDAFSRKNTGRAVEESLAALLPVAALAGEEGLGLRAYISTAFVCPYQGRIEPEAVIAVLRVLRGLGVANVSLADTIGAADPARVDRLLDAIAASDAGAPGSDSPLDGIALHLHDTSRRALANAVVGLQYGIAEFDSSAGGLGGCPFAPGAAGNLDTELLAATLHAMGIPTGIDLDRHRQAAACIRAALEKSPPAPKPRKS